jgi:transcriptional regulator with XRE-family HTH domain
MQRIRFPVIDMAATGRNIARLRRARGLTVRDVQTWFGFEEPQAVYKWQSGRTLPSVDNLFALSALLEVPMDEILVPAGGDEGENGQQASACCLGFLFGLRRQDTAVCGLCH